MVLDGLKKYGYTSLANEIADKMLLAVSTQLKKNHNFWESYSPDNEVLNSPPNYIWDSIMARVLIEKYK
jgi:neutral trehalase